MFIRKSEINGTPNVGNSGHVPRDVAGIIIQLWGRDNASVFPKSNFGGRIPCP